MSIRLADSTEVRDLAGQRHASTGIAFPPQGLQPYYDWLLQTLSLLADASCGPLRVSRDDGSSTAVHLSPGRCSINGVVLDVPAQSLELAAMNNDTALLWITDDEGDATLGHASANSGDWPATMHIKLAEVTLAAGRITAILDRRFETILAV